MQHNPSSFWSATQPIQLQGAGTDGPSAGFKPVELLRRRADETAIVAYLAAKQQLQSSLERWRDVVVFLLLLVRHAPANRLRPLDPRKPAPLLSNAHIWHDQTWSRIMASIGYSVPLACAAAAEHRHAQHLRAAADHAQADAEQARRKAEAAAEQALFALHRAQAATRAAEAASRACVAAQFIEEYSGCK